MHCPSDSVGQSPFAADDGFQRLGVRATVTSVFVHSRVVAVVQARLGSTRLPRKVLSSLGGSTVLGWVVGRLERAERLHEIVIATTWLAEDDPIEQWCLEHGVTLVRGHPTDLLSRYVLAAQVSEADVVVRVTSDCPLIDPGLVDNVVDRLMAHRVDYCSNTLEPRTFPRGLDAEAFTVAALVRSDREDLDPGTREHVTPHMKSAPGYSRFAVTSVADRSDIRWTIDTTDDLRAVRALVEDFGGEDTFSWQEALARWDAHPEWNAINAHVEQKQVIPTLPQRPETAL